MQESSVKALKVIGKKHKVKESEDGSYIVKIRAPPLRYIVENLEGDWLHVP